MLKYLPNVNFKVRVRDESIGGDNPFKWVTKNTEDYFKNKKIYYFFFTWCIYTDMLNLSIT